MLHSANVIDQVLGVPLVLAVADGAIEGHLPLLDAHIDRACVELGVVGQPIADIFPNAFV
jgi:hypothetical protein